MSALLGKNRNGALWSVAIFNHIDLSNPTSNLSGSGFGTISSSESPRIGQLVLKMNSKRTCHARTKPRQQSASAALQSRLELGRRGEPAEDWGHGWLLQLDGEAQAGESLRGVTGNPWS